MAEAQKNLNTSRDALIDAFLEQKGFSGATRKKLAGDASFRRYERITFKAKTYILMDAPPDKENVRPFIKIDRFLVENGFSAPKILAEDIENGILLLEDFGDRLYARIMERDKASEKKLYSEALKVISALRKVKANIECAEYNDELLLRESMLFPEWFMEKYKSHTLSSAAIEEYKSILTALFPATRKFGNVLVLRDYHAENLLWLEDRNGTDRVGLLDFQDAVIGSPAYDLVSLLEDARRDVEPKLAKELLEEYLSLNKDIEAEAFKKAYYIMGAQRNLKIIGIFARLFIRDGKDVYIKLIPRVWAHLEKDVQAKGLEKLKTWLDKNIPKELRK